MAGLELLERSLSLAVFQGDVGSTGEAGSALPTVTRSRLVADIERGALLVACPLPGGVSLTKPSPRRAESSPLLPEPPCSL